MNVYGLGGATKMFCGHIVRDPEIKDVGQRGNRVCKFSVNCGKDEDGNKLYMNCVCWNELGEALCGLKQGDVFFGIGYITEREYNEKTYRDMNLIYGNSPMGDHTRQIDSTGSEHDESIFSPIQDGVTDELPF